MNSKYIKQPLSAQLPLYIDQELRKIELESSNHALALDALEAAVALLAAPITWTAVTFQNSWTNFGSGAQNVQYTKDPSGRVFLRGLMASGSIGSTAFTLPVGFRPPATMRCAQNSVTAAFATNVFIALQIEPDGDVIPLSSGTATNLLVSLTVDFHTGA